MVDMNCLRLSRNVAPDVSPRYRAVPSVSCNSLPSSATADSSSTPSLTGLAAGEWRPSLPRLGAMDLLPSASSCWRRALSGTASCKHRSRAAHLACSASSSDFAIVTLSTVTGYMHSLEVFLHCLHGLSPEHLTRLTLQLLQLHRGCQLLCITNPRKIPDLRAHDESGGYQEVKTYAVATRFLCSMGTLCRRGLTGNLLSGDAGLDVALDRGMFKRGHCADTLPRGYDAARKRWNGVCKGQKLQANLDRARSVRREPLRGTKAISGTGFWERNTTFQQSSKRLDNEKFS